MQTKMTLSTSIILTLLALSSPFVHPVRAAKPASLEASSQSIVDSYATSSTDYPSPSQTDTSEAVADTNAGSSSSSSVDYSASTSTSAAKAQWSPPRHTPPRRI